MKNIFFGRDNQIFLQKFSNLAEITLFDYTHDNKYKKTKVLSHQMGVFQWVWFKKSEHHSIMWEDFNRHRKKSNKILFEWWYFLSIFICIFYIGLSLFCEKILKCHFFYFSPPYFPRFLSIYWMAFKKNIISIFIEIFLYINLNVFLLNIKYKYYL